MSTADLTDNERRLAVAIGAVLLLGVLANNVWHPNTMLAFGALAVPVLAALAGLVAVLRRH